MAEFSAADRAHILERDGGCLGYRIGMPGRCQGPIQIDHIENGGLQLKGPATPLNGASLCVFHHRLKTERANTYRPVLLDMVAQLEALAAEGRYLWQG